MSRADGAEGGASTSGGELQRGSEGGAGTLQTQQRIRRGHINARRRQELVARRQALHIHLRRRRNPLHSAILIQMTRNTHIYRVPCDGGFSGVGVRCGGLHRCCGCCGCCGWPVPKVRWIRSPILSASADISKTLHPMRPSKSASVGPCWFCKVRLIQLFLKSDRWQIFDRRE